MKKIEYMKVDDVKSNIISKYEKIFIIMVFKFNEMNKIVISK